VSVVLVAVGYYEESEWSHKLSRDEIGYVFQSLGGKCVACGGLNAMLCYYLGNEKHIQSKDYTRDKFNIL